ncbi:MAG: PAS domain S-box protein, partial [Planctomycetota bacterium]
GIYRAEPREPMPVDLSEDEQIRRLYDDWYVAECNQAFAAMYGYEDPEELIGCGVAQFHGSRDDPENIRFLREVIRNDYRCSGEESREVDRDGNVKYFLNNVTGIVDGARLVRVWGTQRDITQRRRAEEQLRRSETRFRQLVETMHDGLWVQKPDGKVTYANQRLAEILARSLDDLLGLDIRTLLDEENREALETLLTEARAGGSGLAEIRWTTPYERTVTTLTSMRQLAPEGESQRLFGVLTDISEQKRLEAALVQAQKMEAVGRLAGGIAHDFNNQLTVIEGYCDLLLRSQRVDEQSQQLVAEVQRAASRSARLTSQLLAFSRKQVLRPSVLDLNGVLAEMRDPLGRMLGEDVRLVVEPGENITPVRADRYQLEQALMNLAVNARDAMPSGGQMSIRTRNAELTEDEAENLDVSPGRYAKLIVSDTGTGMSEATRQRIFEPFFTTKEIGKGTGLGLSMVYGFVKQSGGHIDVDSRAGEGTTFAIWLPQAVQQEQPVEEEAEPPAHTGRHTVLVAEDEEPLRRLIVRALENHGYEVLQAASGEEALPRAQDCDGPLHLLVTDVIMPGMDGPELACRLRQTRGNLAVLYISGYAQDRIARDSASEAGVELLSKPFTPNQLLEAVTRALSESPAEGQ